MSRPSGAALQPYEARPYREGVGVALLNRDDLVFVGQRIDQTARPGRCRRAASIPAKIR